MTPTPAVPPPADAAPTTCPVRHFDQWEQSRTAPVARADHTGKPADHPVSWSDRHGGFWVLSRHDDVRAALDDHARFSPAAGVVPAPPPTPMASGPEQDPPERTPLRRLYAEWLNPRLLREFHPLIVELTERHVGDFARAGGGDFVAAVSARLPVQIIARTLGIDPDAAVTFYRVSDEMTRTRDPKAAMAAAMRLFGLGLEHVEMRRRRPRDDFLSTVCAATVGGRPISDETVVGWLAGAVFAGHETTLMAGAAQINDLAGDPALQRCLRERPELIPRVVEESLRVNSPVQCFFRTLTEDVELHGVRMRAGDKVLLVHDAGTVDPARCPDPLGLDVERDFIRHFGFGWGGHRRIGAPLARRELRVLTEVMLRTGDFRPAGAPRFGAPGARGSFPGIDALPLAMTAFDRT